MRRSLVLTLAGTLALVACSSAEPLPIPPGSGPPPVLMVRIPSNACDGTPHAFGARVGRIRISVDGEVVQEGPFSIDGSTGVPLQQEAGLKDALVAVELRDGASALLARGWVRTDLDAAATGDLTIPVYGVERSTPPTAPDGRCATLGAPKAGHRATLMDDGRVLFTGGVAPQPGGPAQWLETVEGLNPQAWTVGEGPPARAFGPEPRAHHGAVKLKDGRLLIFGGERGVGSVVEVTHSALVYDPIRNDWAVLDRLRTARSRPHFGIDGEGRILVAGGFNAPSGSLAPLDSYEWFEPEAGIFNDGLGVFPARALGAMEHLAGTAFVVAGGLDGAAVKKDALALKFNPAQGFMPEAEAPQPLGTGRARVAHAKLGNDWMLAAGGTGAIEPEATDVTASRELSLVAYGKLPAPAAPALPAAVVDACAVAIPPRGTDLGRVLIIGGLGDGGALNPGIWEVVRATGDKVSVREVGRLGTARFGHTCTAMKDGSVVIAGGFTAADRSAATASIEWFLPENAGAPGT